ncbi:MAG: hypothetical protein H0V67_09545 [Geodermatophilaceae bacterium]|nr:hypothetical protein [Geodermatophilaceae bacterium]
MFGAWVKDVALPRPRWRLFRVAHTRYWEGGQAGQEPGHIDALRAALRLNSGQDLMDVAAGRPAYAVADHRS